MLLLLLCEGAHKTLIEFSLFIVICLQTCSVFTHGIKYLYTNQVWEWEMFSQAARIHLLHVSGYGMLYDSNLLNTYTGGLKCMLDLSVEPKFNSHLLWCKLATYFLYGLYREVHACELHNIHSDRLKEFDDISAISYLIPISSMCFYEQFWTVTGRKSG